MPIDRSCHSVRLCEQGSFGTEERDGVWCSFWFLLGQNPAATGGRGSRPVVSAEAKVASCVSTPPGRDLEDIGLYSKRGVGVN